MSKNVIQIHIGTYTLYIMAVYDELAILFESYSRKNGFEMAHNWPVKATCPYMSMVWLLWTGSSFSFICNDMIPGNLINDRLSHHWLMSSVLVTNWASQTEEKTSETDIWLCWLHWTHIVQLVHDVGHHLRHRNNKCVPCEYLLIWWFLYSYRCVISISLHSTEHNSAVICKFLRLPISF